MDVLREIFVLLGLKTEDKDFEHALMKVEVLKKGLEMMVDVVKEVAHKVVEMFEGVAREGAELEHLSKRTGISTEMLQTLGVAAALTGSDLSSVSMGMRGLSMHMYQAAEGSQEAKAAFAKLGVRATDTEGKLRPLEEVIKDVAAKFETMPDGPEKLALASKLFARGGGQMILVLEKMAYAQREAEDSGSVMSEAMTKDAVALHEAIFGTELSFKGLRNAIVGPLLGPLKDVIDEFNHWLRANRLLIAAGLTKVIRGIGTAFYVLWRMAKPVIELFADLLQQSWFLKAALAVLALVIANSVGSAIIGVIPAIGKLTGALKTLTLWEALASIEPVLIGAAFLAMAAAIALATDDISTFIKGTGRSDTGDFVDNVKGVVAILSGMFSRLFNAPVEDWKRVLKDFIAWALKAFTVGMDAIKAVTGQGANIASLGVLGSSGGGAGGLLGGGAAGPSAAAVPEGVTLAQRFAATFHIQTTPGMDNAAVGTAVRESLDGWAHEMFDQAYDAVVGQYGAAGGG